MIRSITALSAVAALAFAAGQATAPSPEDPVRRIVSDMSIATTSAASALHAAGAAGTVLVTRSADGGPLRTAFFPADFAALALLDFDADDFATFADDEDRAREIINDPDAVTASDSPLLLGLLTTIANEY